MTLELELHEIKGLKNPQYVYVEGSQAGCLRLRAKKQGQRIKCSKDDHLVIYICGKHSQMEPDVDNIISTVDFWANATIEQNRDTWNAKEAVKYSMNCYDDKDKKLGQIVFKVKYDKGKYYYGEINGCQRAGPIKLPLYKSTCPTYNLYNCLDKHAESSRFNLIQDIYRD